jgi:hypothetical protein
MDYQYISKILSKEYYRNIEIIKYGQEVGEDIRQPMDENFMIKISLDRLGLELCEK